jgi:phosphatidylserine decarboxylase
MKRISYFDVLCKPSPAQAQLIVTLNNRIFAASSRTAPLDPTVQALRDFVMLPENVFLRIYIGDMLDEANRKQPIAIKTPTDFFLQVNNALHTYPKFDANFMLALPFFLILSPFMSTGSGWAFFTNETVRPFWAAILKSYHARLDVYPDSCVYLNDSYGNWFSPDAWNYLQMDQYPYDPSQPYGGYQNWNDFFKRPFTDINSSRPVPSNPDGLTITSPVDGQVFQISENVHLKAAFDIKGEQYYLTDLLHEPSDSPLLQPFVNGLAIQIVLMPINYHRWHAPVTGKVLKVETVPGYFFAQPAPNQDYANSFPFLSHINCRTIVILESSIGPVAMVFVGLTEVSSTVPHPNVQVGAEIKQGDEIGYYAYGGSTCCILFDRALISKLYVSAAQDNLDGNYNDPSPDKNQGMPNIIDVRAALALAQQP